MISRPDVDPRGNRTEFLPARTVDYAGGIPERERLIPAHGTSNIPVSAVSLVTLRDVSLWCNRRTNYLYDERKGCHASRSVGYEGIDLGRVTRTPVEHVPGRTVFFDHLDPQNYYHWLIDSVPYFGVLEMAGVDLARVDRFYIHRNMSRFQEELLRRFGVADTDVLSYEGKDVHYRFDELVIPLFRSDGSLWPNPWAVDYLRGSLGPGDVIDDAPAGSGRPLYIERGESRRAVSNEGSLVERLEAEGFSILRPAGCTVAEQIDVMSRSRHVLAAHGAGLANIVFAPPGAKVMEFCGQYLSSHFRMLSEFSGHTYRPIVGERGASAGATVPPRNQADRTVDFEVDIDKVVGEALAFFGSS